MRRKAFSFLAYKIEPGRNKYDVIQTVIKFLLEKLVLIIPQMDTLLSENYVLAGVETQIIQ